VAKECEKIIQEKATTKGWEILEISVQPDHIHLFVRTWPTDSASDVVKECKGATSRLLRQQHPILKRLPSLWTRSYFASTAGNVSSETIKRYIEQQGKK
jgi:putative transposase